MNESAQPVYVELVYGLLPGTLVWWDTLGGRKDGVLKEWDNGTAIVTMADGTEQAVRCV